MVSPVQYIPKAPLLIIVGNYGSGKTEVSVNLALALAASHNVKIVDLDIVNPYFRCREARELMEAKGIKVIYPEGEFQSADLPIILPEVKGSLFSKDSFVIFDVGGDDMGARVLSSLADSLAGKPYEMLQVINSRRPFTQDRAGCLRIKEEIEAASRLKINGVISNAHLMEDTDADTVREGLKVARAVAEHEGLPLVFATVNPNDVELMTREEPDCPFMPISRKMLPPWKLKSMTDRAGQILKDDSKQ